ncbi:MAG TPA: head decoration protein [Armatimonadota bacterium]|nr:head decoration protein [Armatimonadota bacterium]
MPTTAITTWTNLKLEPAIHPEDVRTIAVKLGASLSLARGTVLAQKTADSKWYAYNNANADGTETARAILPYDVQTDASGNVTYSSTASQAGGEHGQKDTSVPVYVKGTFKTADLTGLDAAGVTDLGRLISGTLADGILQLH